MEKKIRIYLDTNVIVGWFKNRIIEEKKNIPFIMPERLAKLQELQHELFVSPLVKAEISRYLHSEWQLSPSEISIKWELFVSELKINTLELKQFMLDLEELNKICIGVPLKREGTVADLVHLQIAKSFNLKFLTSERKLKRKLSNFYSNIIQINELS